MAGVVSTRGLVNFYRVGATPDIASLAWGEVGGELGGAD